MKENIRRLTFGEKLVGFNFNHSGNEKVQRAKELCAELANIANDHWCRNAYCEKSFLENQIYHNAIGEILNAQMNVVKLLTLKY